MSDYNNKKKRKAIIIGINKYEDTALEKLEGAENDAEEIYEKITDSFADTDKKKFVGSLAKYINIKQEIEEIFEREKDPYQLVIIYFSGYLYTQPQGETWIAPYDMNTKIPTDRGIRLGMGELAAHFSRQRNVEKIVLILDCRMIGPSAEPSLY